MKEALRSASTFGAFALVLSWFAFAACSSSSSDGGIGIGAGGSDASIPDGGTEASGAPSRVWLASSLGLGSQAGINDATQCPIAMQQWIAIGDPTTTTSVADGDTDTATGNIVSVSCKVYSETDGFHVEATATLGVQGGVTLSGHFTANTGTTLLLQNIDAKFSRADTGSYVESSCTATYTTNPQQMGVAAGRIWADLDCPTATQSAQSHTCEGKASFKLENCAMAP